jgi:hypothetical protein
MAASCLSDLTREFVAEHGHKAFSELLKSRRKRVQFIGPIRVGECALGVDEKEVVLPIVGKQILERYQGALGDVSALIDSRPTAVLQRRCSQGPAHTGWLPLGIGKS